MRTSRGVIDNLMRGKTVERIGFMDLPWSQTLKKWVGQGYPTDEEGEPVDATSYFDFDMAGAGGGFSLDAKLNADEIIKETEEWKIVRNGRSCGMEMVRL